MRRAFDYDELDRKIGDQLGRLRVERGIRQLVLAERLQTTQSMISKVESGGRSLKVREMPQYARALGMETPEFFEKILATIK